MQLDQVVNAPKNADTPTNDSRYFDRGVRLVSFGGEQTQTTETMQESLGIQLMDSMARPLSLWRRLYRQWSKQLLQI